MMKRFYILFILLISANYLPAMDDNSSTFNGSYWIGAITRKEAKLPEGRNYFDAELKKQEVKDAWNAVPEISKRSIYLRKKFNVKSNLKKATAYICGLGLYEFTLNGKKVGDMEFAPLWSDYDKSVFYNVFDVTKLLAKRGNAVGVMLGNGFYNVNGGRYRKLQISFGPPTLRFVLMLEYKDGTTDKVVSDGSWRYDVSPVLFNCIYGGEDYDARLEQDGWDIENFNAAGWKEVVIQEGPKGVMRQQIAEPVKIMEYYSPVKSKRLSQEEIASASKKTKREIGSVAYVLDMAQNLSGFPEIKVKGRRGQTVTLIPGESLTEEGAVNQRETGRQVTILVIQIVDHLLLFVIGTVDEIVPIEALESKLHTTFMTQVFVCDGALGFQSGTGTDGIKCCQSLDICGRSIITQYRLGKIEIDFGHTEHVGIDT